MVIASYTTTRDLARNRVEIVMWLTRRRVDA
jgi:hypothetical protein